jgi:RNA polymerase sigma factor (sigma-70 family)
MPPSIGNAPRTLSDGDLVAAARLGDAPALGALLERHRPRLLAAAIRLLGYRQDAEDAVQETFLIAMRHLGAIRDADAVGGWLHSVLRRACLQHQRRIGGEVLTDSLPDLVDGTLNPEERIERLELRDWIWASLEQLPEPLRVTAMLRYFGSYDSYAEVAAILGVPIGTVRSRLSEAKLKLADALLATAGLVGDDNRTRASERARFWADAFQDIFRRGESTRFVSHFDHDLLVAWSSGKVVRGRRHLADEINDDLEVGVRLDLERVMTNDGIVVVEARFVNPAEAPAHCPPGIAMVLSGDGEMTSSIRLHLSPRPPRSGEE